MKLCVVDDEREVHRSIRNELKKTGGFEIVEHFLNGLEALRTVPRLSCHQTIVLDITMPGLDGLQCLHRLKRMKPAIRILMVTNSKRSDRVMQALVGHADGYCVKKDGYLAEALKELDEGGFPISKTARKSICEPFRHSDDVGLTEREEQILACLLTGDRDKEIAVKLGLNLRTVEGHVHRLRRKFGVHSRKSIVAEWLGVS